MAKLDIKNYVFKHANLMISDLILLDQKSNSNYVFKDFIALLVRFSVLKEYLVAHYLLPVKSS